MVFGDIHGKQDLMYEAALKWEGDNKESLDAILQVGDFFAIRNRDDLQDYYAPDKYPNTSDFPDYYSGFKQAPFLTVFIGGNHEAWGFLKNHNKGGFLAPNIYFLGRSGRINVKGIEIGGLSGVYHPDKYKSPLPEDPCYDWKYYREQDMPGFKSIDVLLLHDWITPVSGIEIIKEDNIQASVNTDKPSPAFNIVSSLNPKYAFMGHKHKSYLEGRLNKTLIYGLPQFDEEKNPLSFKVISL